MKIRNWTNTLLALILLAMLILPEAQSASAQTTSLSGWFHVIWGNDAHHAFSTVVYQLTDDAGNATMLSLNQETIAAAGGLSRINGKRVIIQSAEGVQALNENGQFTVGSILLDSEAPQAQADLQSQVSGAQPWVTVMCKFSDIDAEPKDYNYFLNMYGSTYPGFNHYWQEQSYNIMNINGSTVAGTGGTHWFTLPSPQSAYLVPQLNLQKAANDCSAAADSVTNFSDFVGINFVFNGDLDGSAWGGSSTLLVDDTANSWYTTWLPPFAYNSIGVIAHEMGHGFGLPHSASNDGAPFNYDNYWDVMSSNACNTDPIYGCQAQHTISYHKDTLGWITAAEKYTAVGTATITIDALALPSTPNYRMAQIPIGGSSTHFYTVEVRNQTGYDTPLPGKAVIIHEVDTIRDEPAHVIDLPADGNTSDAGAMWVVGETFTDAPNGVSVNVVAETANGFQVIIVTPAAPAATYCSSSGTSANEYINKVVFNNSTKTSTYDADGYEDYTGAQLTTLAPGNSYPIEVTVNSPVFYRTEQVKIWVDFNNDSDFADSGEEIDLGSATFSGIHAFSGIVTVPAAAVIGTPRMRTMVRFTGKSIPAPCSESGDGETEDYKVGIANSPASVVELAQNGGFNTYKGTSKVPTLWKAVKFAAGDGKDKQVKKEGAASIKINGAFNTTKTLTQTLLTLSGNAGDSFTFSFWAKGSSIPLAGTCKVQVILYNGGSPTLTKTIKCANGSYTTFKKKTILFSTASAYTNAVIKFTYAKSSGTIWFDKVSLIR